MRYKLTTIERDRDGNLETHSRPYFTGSSLARVVDDAKRFGFVPGAKSGTGLTIVETIFESA